MSSEVAQQPAPQPVPQPQPSPQTAAAPQPPRPAGQASTNRTVRRVIIWSLVLCLPLFLLFLVMAGIGSLMSSSSGALIEKNYSKRLWTSGRHKIAIIHLDGTIMSSEGFIKKQIDQVIDDESVKGVVFR